MSASHDHDEPLAGGAPPLAVPGGKRQNRRQRRAAALALAAQPGMAPETAPAAEAPGDLAAAELPEQPIPATDRNGDAASLATALSAAAVPAPMEVRALPQVRRSRPLRTIRLTSEQTDGAPAPPAVPIAAPMVKPDMLMLVMLLVTLVLAGTAGSLYFRLGDTPLRQPMPAASTPVAEPPPPVVVPPAVPPTAAEAPRSNPLEDYRQGLRYALGNGVPQDYEKAANLLLKAALRGVPDAQYNLGALYASGLGVPKDPVQAATWYQAAAQQKHPLAAFNLALAYVDGTGVEQSDTEAARWFRRAAEQGVSNAQFDLAALYLTGRGVERSPTEAYAWFSVLSASGDNEARQQVDRLASAMSRQELATARERAARLAEIVNHR